mgnify:CR=1 FL=1
MSCLGERGRGTENAMDGSLHTSAHGEKSTMVWGNTICVNICRMQRGHGSGSRASPLGQFESWQPQGVETGLFVLFGNGLKGHRIKHVLVKHGQTHRAVFVEE